MFDQRAKANLCPSIYVTLTSRDPMSTENVQKFLDRSSTDQALLAKVRAARGADSATTASNVATLAGTIGLTFTADEYIKEVENEVSSIFQLHRAITHHL